MPDAIKGLEQLMAIVSKLRGQDGCPWDRKQSPQTLKPYLLEETHEAMQAIDDKQPAAVREELGDLLFIIVFLCQLYQENGDFTIAEALQDINDKMVRRHPHVFNDLAVGSDEELRNNWLAMKEKEKRQQAKNEGTFSSIPQSLPALRRAQRVSEKAAHNGFEWPGLAMVFAKLSEESAELQHAASSGNSRNVLEEIGDILLVIVNISRLLRANPEEALHKATDKFIRRYEKMEKQIIQRGESMAQLGIDELLSHWQSAKNN
jgi:tetrapyrrole methylase family protein/MazG family protein/ATP diphosphatase